MPLSPSIRQVADLHNNQALQTVSVAYMQGNNNWPSAEIFPIIGVPKMSDLFWRWPKGTFFRENVAVRSPGAEPPRISWKVQKDSYLCEIYEIAEDIFDEERSNADSEFELDATATVQITQQLLLKREREWASKYFSSGVWSRELSGVASGTPNSSQFLRFDAAGSDPMTFIQTEVIRMQESTGFRPNFLLMTPYIELALANHPLLLDRIKYTGVATALNIQTPGAGTKAWRAMLAEVLNVPRIYVADVVFNGSNAIYDDDPTADPNNTAGMQFLYGKSMLLGYAAPNAGKKVPSAGYTFTWSGYTGASSPSIRFLKDRSVVRRADTIVGETAFTHQVICPDLAVFMEDVVS